MNPAVTHKLTHCYVRYRMYTNPLKNSWLFEYVVFVLLVVVVLGVLVVFFTYYYKKMYAVRLENVYKRRNPPIHSISLKVVGDVTSVHFVRKYLFTLLLLLLL